jgi:hypothetical protein
VMKPCDRLLSSDYEPFTVRRERLILKRFDPFKQTGPYS